MAGTILNGNTYFTNKSVAIVKVSTRSVILNRELYGSLQLLLCFLLTFVGVFTCQGSVNSDV